jgi:3-oxoacyl-[acyl-carrier-protein] synthase-3
MTSRCAKIVGLGACIPERVLTNADLETMVDTSDEWIVERTGIRERHIVAENQATSDLAIAAARQALDEAGLTGRDLDAILLATVTQDYTGFPATACLVQHALGAGGFALDIAAACSGWIYSLALADQMIRAGGVRTVLCMGAECLSRITDYSDRDTCVLFGDGAGAAVVTAGEPEEGGIVAWDLGSNGEDPSILWLPAGGSRKPATAETVAAREHYLRMRGRDVFVFATRVLGQTCDRTLEKAGVSPDQVTLLVPHQANERITLAAQQRFSIPPERVVRNVARYGNTSSASVPIALREALDEGRVHKGDLVMAVAFGGGLTWASCLIRWAY